MVCDDPQLVRAAAVRTHPRLFMLLTMLLARITPSTSSSSPAHNYPDLSCPACATPSAHITFFCSQHLLARLLECSCDGRHVAVVHARAHAQPQSGWRLHALQHRVRGHAHHHP